MRFSLSYHLRLTFSGSYVLMSQSTYRKISSNLTLAGPPTVYPCPTRIARERCTFFRNIFPPLRHRRLRRNTYTCAGESSSSSSGNKVCFIFTIPLAKYRPVFPRDIDISGVPGLLLLTPFLHWHGIYVFFLLFPSRSLPPALLLFCSALSSPPFYVFSTSPSLSSIFLVLLPGRYLAAPLFHHPRTT